MNLPPNLRSDVPLRGMVQYPASDNGIQAVLDAQFRGDAVDVAAAGIEGHFPSPDQVGAYYDRRKVPADAGMGRPAVEQRDQCRLASGAFEPHGLLNDRRKFLPSWCCSADRFPAPGASRLLPRDSTDPRKSPVVGLAEVTG